MAPKVVSVKLLVVYYIPVILNLISLCLSYDLPQTGVNSDECEKAALNKVDAETCMSIGAPQATVLAIQIVDCRLSLIGKAGLKCTYHHERGVFKCKNPMTDSIAKEVLTTLLSIFEGCQATHRDYFQSEVASLLTKLTLSAKTAEDMHLKVLESKFPFKLLQRIKEVQQDEIYVGNVVLRKAQKLLKKASEIRHTISNLEIRKKLDKAEWNEFPSIENCFSTEEDEREENSYASHCIHQFGLCFSGRLLDWLFSVACTSLFLFMIFQMEGTRGQPISLLLGTAILALRAYSSSHNYTTFLEQFFLESVVGYFMLSFMIWMSSMCGVRS